MVCIGAGYRKDRASHTCKSDIGAPIERILLFRSEMIETLLEVEGEGRELAPGLRKRAKCQGGAWKALENSAGSSKAGREGTTFHRL
jgi:hypothetical protein